MKNNTKTVGLTTPQMVSGVTEKAIKINVSGVELVLTEQNLYDISHGLALECRNLEGLNCFAGAEEYQAIRKKIIAFRKAVFWKKEVN